MSSAAVVIGALRVNINSWGMGLRVWGGGGGGRGVAERMSEQAVTHSATFFSCL